MKQIEQDRIVAIFDDPQLARRAGADLRRAGFHREQIEIEPDETEALGGDSQSRTIGATLIGALLGAVLGGLAGALLTGAISGIGAVIAFDSLTAAFAGAAIGALLGGIISVTRSRPSGEFPAARTDSHAVVTVTAADRASEAARILRGHGGYGEGLDIDTSRTETHLDDEEQGRAQVQAAWQGRDDQTRPLLLSEERLSASKELRQLGTVHVRKEVDRDVDYLDVEARRDEVLVEHVPSGEIVAERREPWEEDGTLVVPIYEEQLVVVKRLVLRETVRVRRVPSTEMLHFEEPVRRERLVIEDPDGTGTVRERYSTDQDGDEIVAEGWSGERPQADA